MTLTRHQRFAYRLLGPFVQRPARTNAHLRLALQRAHIPLRPEVYLAYTHLNMLVAFAATGVVVIALAAASSLGAIDIPGAAFALLLPLPFALALVIYLLGYLLPDLKASARARDIDAKLPYALNYIAAMASVGVTPERIFTSLAHQRLYGEVANEAAWIARDVKLLGSDLMTGLNAAIDRSPSTKWQDFLQGAVTALSSGENLKTYFLTKAEQYVLDNRQAQRRFLDNLGLLAESYVTVVVAAPLLLIVLLSVMTMFGGNGGGSFFTGYLLLLVLLPLAILGFGFTIKHMTPEV